MASWEAVLLLWESAGDLLGQGIDSFLMKTTKCVFIYLALVLGPHPGCLKQFKVWCLGVVPVES